MLYDQDKTIRQKISPIQGEVALVTIFDGDKAPYTIDLSINNKNLITFGRDKENDIVLTSKLVSRSHGCFLIKNGEWYIEDRKSTNGILYNNTYIKSRLVIDGDFIRIDDGVESLSTGVLFIFSAAESQNKWSTFQLKTANQVTIGRDAYCDIVLPHISVSKQHAIIVKEGTDYYVIDNHSANGIILNNHLITGKQKLHEKDVITITNAKLIFADTTIYYCSYNNGISVDGEDIVIKRGKKNKCFITSNHVSLGIKPGELVAIIGGSGAGKSTILNCLCGYLPPSEGEVYINGVNLYQNFNSIKKQIGYVPQSDIVFDNLTLRDMLMYTAKLRLPADTTQDERELAIDRAIDTVELTEKKDSLIKALSGGQRKRASIAVELLSDPNLLFLDEPASGLDPGTERNLMHSLRNMANSGKTIILVTHSTLQLHLCDKIVFMGKGGNLCFYGSYVEALNFFEVSDVVDIYNMITDHAMEWSKKYQESSLIIRKSKSSQHTIGNQRENKSKQLSVLCSRYTKLVINDRQRLLLLLLQAPLLAILISFVADGQEFKQYEMTKSLLFALSCSAFWVGMLNAIQEICKERTITKREYMTGLSLSAYILSKIIVLGCLCLIQSLFIIVVFRILVGVPDTGLMMNPLFELFLTTFFTAMASTAMGLLVSSLFTNADRAMTVAPILLMPQILFSGLIFKLKGATEIISWVAICRWSMEGYGTTANLNQLPLKLQQEGIAIPHEMEDFFQFKTLHLLFDWLLLIVFCVLFSFGAKMILSKLKSEKA